ncbi:hypothetical protein M3Y95_00810200 [Aphelenchoides besseyi]|nr:hypothetical protein M3Y95_00810200 [Aphelenchoides besseyi]
MADLIDELIIDLHDSEGSVREYRWFFGNPTVKNLEVEIQSTLLIQPTFQTILFDGKRLDTEKPETTLSSHGLENMSRIIVKHAELKTWKLYREKAETVIKQKMAPDQTDSARSACCFANVLDDTEFFLAYDTFWQYRNEQHWRVARYLDGDDQAITNASREHFLHLHKLKGDTMHSFHFEYVSQKKAGTRPGIICNVTLNHTLSKLQVKTHHYGVSIFANNKAVSGPVIQELFCYKLLELIGVGPAVQFVCPSKDLGSRTAVYIATAWRDDFMQFTPADGTEIEPNGDALVQLHLLQLILNIEDLHVMNCGQWKESKQAAIVDLFHQGIERTVSTDDLLEKSNRAIGWSDKAQLLFESLPRDNFRHLAKTWLTNTWKFLENVDTTHGLIDELITSLKQKHGTRFRGFDTDKDEEIYNAQVTVDLDSYVEEVKENAIKFL